MIPHVTHHFLPIQDHLNQYAVVQKELKQLAIKSHMRKIVLFVIKRNVKEIVENYASVNQGEESSFFSAIKFSKDEVLKRCILCNTVGEIFSADLMYH